MTPRPMLATSAAEPPEGPQWTYEVKWDGYRALALKDGSRVQLISRNQKDLTHDYPTVVAAIQTVRQPSVILDGEVVALDAEGHPSFQALQHRSTSGLAIVYYAFDVLTVGRESLLRQSVEARRQRLKLLLVGSHLLLSEPLPGSPQRIEREIRRLGLEGVIATRRDSPYRPGERSDAWVKVKFSPRQEFVIGGYKQDATNFESILIGYYDKRRLYFAGKVRAGRSRWGEGITEADMRTLRWLRPTIVVEVSFVEWTQEGLLRHASLVALRDDKRAADVRRNA